MGLSKKEIVTNISAKTLISNLESKEFLETFLQIVKSNIKNLKISKFGSFSIEKTPQRLGRNPKTLESFLILEKNRISFKASTYIKNYIN
jgi:nucleoid DNA-binding protein